MSVGSVVFWLMASIIHSSFVTYNMDQNLPMDLRYFNLARHWKSILTFTWYSLLYTTFMTLLLPAFMVLFFLTYPEVTTGLEQPSGFKYEWMYGYGLMNGWITLLLVTKDLLLVALIRSDFFQDIQDTLMTYLIPGYGDARYETDSTNQGPLGSSLSEDESDSTIGST